ncbi:MAG: BatA domain-containing protein, partial [Alphaproteobacteria bacterium]|nr:BatA domain-containing protein [Alphaproteobacteria bacterium]
MASRARLLATSAALGAGGVALGMTGIGPLFFASAAAPAILGAGGAALPGLWHLMQTIPPRPKIVDFPMIRLLFNLSSEDKQAASIPLWQRLVRLGAVSAVILGLSEPQFEAPSIIEPGKGPVLMVVDNSWDS